MSTPRGLAPAAGPIRASVKPPGSKSVTIRALAAAALAPGRSHLYGPLDADDTLAMAEVLRGFGVAVAVGSEPWTVDGRGSDLRTPDQVLDAGESGLTARIAIAMAALVDGEVTIDGVGRLRMRPLGPLLDALANQGVSFSASDGTLPVTVSGHGGLWGGEIAVDSTLSSQFVTALLLVAPTTREPTRLRIEGDRGAAGYVELTGRVMSGFGAEVDQTITGYEVPNTGYHPADFQVEPDVSAAVYPMVAAAITGGSTAIEGVWLDSLQPDIAVADRLRFMGCSVTEGETGLVIEGPEILDPIETDMAGAPDGALALAVACLFASAPSRITGLSTLRHKESDRLFAMSQEMEKLGARATVDGDTLRIDPGILRGATIDPHGDHRVAMSLALVGLRVGGVVIEHPEVVNKTWPGYWETMTSATTSPLE